MASLRAQPEVVRNPGDVALARSLVLGSPRAWSEFVERFGDVLLELVGSVFEGEQLSTEHRRILEGLREDGCRGLRDYDGRSRLATFLRLRAGDMLAQRICELFGSDPLRAWHAFERFYVDDVTRLVRRSFPPASSFGALPPAMSAEDAYQEVCACLVADSFRRLRAFDGRGRFSAFVRRVVRNLCVDLRRREAGRRRLPESVKGSPLGADAYRLVVWQGVDAIAAIEALRPKWLGTHSDDELRRAVGHASALRVSEPTVVAGVPEPELLDERPSPEASLIEAESTRQRERRLQALGNAVAALASDERLYVQLRFYASPPKSPREIAALMGRTIEDVYRLREKSIGALRAALAADAGNDPAVRPQEAGDP